MYKTRALAVTAIGAGRVAVNGTVAKPGREMCQGDHVTLRQAGWTREVVVLALGTTRGPPSAAMTLYQETAQSLAARALAQQQRRIAQEPAAALAQGRPTKRDRRALTSWQRWSASVDDE